MIRRLCLKMTLLVVSVLILVSAGIVFSINLMNWNNITSSAEDALTTLAENSGARPSQKKSSQEPVSDAARRSQETEPGEDGTGMMKPGAGRTGAPQLPEGKEPGSNRESGNRPGQPPEMESASAIASLSNYYVVSLSSDDSITGWTSDREELYTDWQIQDLTDLALNTGKKSGRIGTQFFALTTIEGKKKLIVLDQRLEILHARSVLRTTAIIAALSCLLLCIAAYFLIRAMVRPVEEAFEKQRQFVWNASHELKTPLAVIGTNADVLSGDIGENEYLGYIRSEVKRTDRLLQSLLTLARMDQGTQKAHFEKLDLGKTVLAVALPFESMAFEAGVDFQIDVPEQILCSGDRDMLQQLTVILLSNAFKYVNEKGTVRLTLQQRGKAKHLAVSNTGEGISKEDLGRIFDRFYRADTSHNREKEGYGLGLSIAQNIVREHKGKIHAASDPGRETVFTVILP